MYVIAHTYQDECLVFLGDVEGIWDDFTIRKDFAHFLHEGLA